MTYLKMEDIKQNVLAVILHIFHENFPKVDEVFHVERRTTTSDIALASDILLF
jgi:hypothetical protein